MIISVAITMIAITILLGWVANTLMEYPSSNTANNKEQDTVRTLVSCNLDPQTDGCDSALHSKRMSNISG